MKKRLNKLGEYLAFFLAAYSWIQLILAFGYIESVPWFLAAVAWTTISFEFFKDVE